MWWLSRPPRWLKLSEATSDKSCNFFWSLEECQHRHQDILEAKWCESTPTVHIFGEQQGLPPEPLPWLKALWQSVSMCSSMPVLQPQQICNTLGVCVCVWVWMLVSLSAINWWLVQSVPHLHAKIAGIVSSAPVCSICALCVLFFYEVEQIVIHNKTRTDRKNHL